MNLMPIFIALVVIAEIAFLGSFDMTKNAAMVNSWADSLLHQPPPAEEAESQSVVHVEDGGGACEEWLKREDTVVYSRDFDKDPILVDGRDKVEFHSCLNCGSNLE